MTSPSVGPGVAFGDALRFWLRLGFINFGGPAGQIAIMHRELVERRGWVSEERFLRALNFCMVLPGPEAQQLATYIGWWLHGWRGGVVAGSFFVLPSVALLLFLSWLAVAQAEVPVVAGLLYGVQPVVVAIVAEAVLRIGRRALQRRALLPFAALAFVALYFGRVPFPIVIGIAAAAGFLLSRVRQDLLVVAGQVTPAQTAVRYPSPWRALRIACIFLALWAVPVSVLWAWRGGDSVLMQEALFFTQAAFVTFGGAYAVLAYVAQVAVEQYGWLDPQQMVRGLALAETTPGPLIMVLQYVGFLGAWRFPGDLSPLTSAILGGLTTTYVTFLPSFLFIFVGAPYIEALAANRALQGALAAVTAAVVGVILNLAVFLALEVLLPSAGTPDLYATVVALGAFLLLWWRRWSVAGVVGLGAGLGVVWEVVGRAVA